VWTEQEVDATYMGNKLRFINNADTNLANCHVKILMCNTILRIGMYASTDLEPGTELFFHYNYTQEQTKGFKQPKSNLVAAKQTTKPVKEKLNYGPNSLSSGDEASGLSSGTYHPKALVKARAVKAEKSAPRTRPLPVTSLRDAVSKEGRNKHCKDPESQDSYLNREIKDTDEDEVEFQPDAMRSSCGIDSDSEAMVVEDSDVGGITPHRWGRPRKQPEGTANVVAVKQQGGSRTGAGQKRKR
jgi:hypothetical protein